SRFPRYLARRHGRRPTHPDPTPPDPTPRGQMTNTGSNQGAAEGPLAGVRIIESSMLGPAAITTTLADLGAEVIKIETPSGDYVRQMTWPIVEGVSLMHLHVNRGKR